MTLTVGVVSKFDRWAPKLHPFRIALERAGLRYVPIALGQIHLTVSPEKGIELSLRGANGRGYVGPKGSDIDVMLWRVSENYYFQCSGLLERISQNHRLVNSITCMKRCSNKWSTYETLASCGLPIVRTQAILPDSPVPELGTKRTIIKPCFGAGGRGVRAVRPGLKIDFSEPYIAQPELASDSDEHVRVLVCGGTPVVAMRRISERASSSREMRINNLDAGGKSIGAPLSPVYEIAAAASRAVGGMLVGVDLVPDQHSGFAILEVNSSPGLEGANQHSARSVYDLAVEAVLADSTRARTSDPEVQRVSRLCM